MGVDQLVTGGDVDDPVVDSLTSDSVNTGRSTLTSGPVRAEIMTTTEESTANWETQNFRTIQNAVDAIPGTDRRTVQRRGKVTVGALGGEGNHYEEGVTIDEKRMILQGQGKSTKIKVERDLPAVNIQSSDDTEVRDIWIDNNWTDKTDGGDCLRTNPGSQECYIDRCNFDHAGRHAVNLNGTRHQLTNTEIKDGDKAAVRINGRQNSIINTVIHDELTQGIPIGIEFNDHQQFRMSHCWIMLNDATRVFDWQGAADNNPMWNNIYIGPSRNANGNVAEDVEFRGQEGIANAIVIRNTGAKFSNCTDFIFNGYIGGGVSSFGTRCVINGTSVNSGNPSNGGAWNGHAEFAFKTGATVLDTSASYPFPQYQAQRVFSDDYRWVEQSISQA